jgi:hypothetical protein
MPSAAPSASPGGGSGFDWDAIALAESGGNWANGDTGTTAITEGCSSPQTPGKRTAAWISRPAQTWRPRSSRRSVADRTAFTGWKGTPPQGLGAWEVITKGMVPGVTTSSRPPTMPAAAPSGSPGMGMPSVVPQAGSLPDVRGAHPQMASVFGAIQQAFPGLKLNAGKDDHGVDGGWHPKGQAIDIGGSPEQMAALSNWLLQFAPEIEEMIHSGPGVTQNIKSGKLGPAIDMPGSVYNTQQAGYHGDHVHLAVTDQMGQALMAAMGGGGGAYPSAGMPTIASPGGLGTQQSPLYVTPAGGGASGGQQLGQDIFSGFLEIFGIDGSVFKNPFGTPLFGGVKSMLSMLTKGGGGAMGGDGAALPSLGGGGDPLSGMLGGLLSNVPQPFGPIGGRPDEFSPVAAGGKTAGPAGFNPAGVWRRRSPEPDRPVRDVRAERFPTGGIHGLPSQCRRAARAPSREVGGLMPSKLIKQQERHLLTDWESARAT